MATRTNRAAQPLQGNVEPTIVNQTFREFNQHANRLVTPPVKMIIAINLVVTLAVFIIGAVSHSTVNHFVFLFAQHPLLSVKQFHIWQFVTYMFVHVDAMHLIFNMLALGFFAPALVQRWGASMFWNFYLTAGVGAGVCHAIIALATGHEIAPIIGASGAVYGVMLAYAAYWPDRTVYLYGALPVKIKHLMIFLFIMAFLSTAAGSGQGISNLTHLTGLGVAYLWLGWNHKQWDIRQWKWL